MQIETYFQQLQDCVEACLVMQSYSLTYDKRSTNAGFVRGEVTFVDNSVLHLREFVDTESVVERLLYVYQYIGADNRLRFRYDNIGHHRRLNLSTYPHHKHVGTEESIVPSQAPDLEAVLREIETSIELP